MAETYNVLMSEPCGGSESITITAGDDNDASTLAEAAVAEWVRDGEYGDDGASIQAYWTLADADGDEVDSGSVTVEIEPDHSALIRAACGRDCGCGYDPDDHDWTSEGEGGCDKNPGVWSTGGTSMSSNTHCRTCGLHRRYCSTGSQRNPGQHDTVEYAMSRAWCEECERVECACE